MLKNLLRVIIVVALPVAVLAWSIHMTGAGAPRLEGKDLGALCILHSAANEGADVECRAKDFVPYLRLFALIALGVALVPVVLFVGTALICGTSRWLNAALFRRLVPLSIVLVCINLLVQGALLLCAMIGIYVAYLGNPPIGALAIAAFGIVTAAGAVVAGAASMRVDPVLPVRGDAVTRKQAPELWGLVDEVAEALGSDKPDHIVVGLDPNFWIISGAVEMVGEGLKGRLNGKTLYVSLPLMRVLKEEEFVGIVGHELGHFRGRDSEYSARFLPVYIAVDGARYSLEDFSDFDAKGPALSIVLTRIARYPAKALLSLLGSTFHRNVQKISRIREYAADEAAAEVAEPRALATALFRLPLFARLWEDILGDHVDRIRAKRIPARALGRYFDDLARVLVTPDKGEALREYALKARTEHPYDSHPSTFNRVKALGIKPAEISPDELRPQPGDGVADLLLGEDLQEELEAALTAAENNALRDMGAIRDVPPGYRPVKIDPLYHAVYSLISALVRAGPDPTLRFAAAVETGYAEMTEFDRMIFAEYCRGRRAALDPVEAVEAFLDLAGTENAGLLLEIADSVYVNDPELDENDQRIRAWLYQTLGPYVPEEGLETAPGNG